MKKVFWRYFIGIFSLALVITVIITGSLLLTYQMGQRRWQVNVYDDFVDAIEDAINSGFSSEYNLNGILKAASSIKDDRVRSFVVREFDTDNSLKPPIEGFLETEGMAPNGSEQNSEQNPAQNEGERKDVLENRLITRVTRINITRDADGKMSCETTKCEPIKMTVPRSHMDQEIVGSVIIAMDGKDIAMIDVMSFTLRTYSASKDVVESCLTGLLIAIPVCLVIAFVGAWYLSSRNAQYINGVRKALKDLAKGKANVSLPKERNSELNEISIAVEDLDRDLQANKRSRKAWLHSISHDLNTPTTAMKMIIDGLNDGVFPADAETFKELQRENETLSERIERVIEFSSLQADTPVTLENMDSKQFISDVLAGFEGREKIESEATCATIRCDGILMGRAVKELLKNAVEASGAVDELVKWTIKEDGDSYEMDIMNVGHIPTGIDTDIFEPWAKGDFSRSSAGSGLGLPIANTIASLHRGRIMIVQESPDIVKATIRWPR